MEKIKNLLVNSKIIFIGGLALLSIFVVIFMSLSNKGSLAIEETEDTFNITCPEKVSAGSEISCSINFNITSMSVQGLNASYRVSEGMEFISFEPAENWRDYSIDGEGLVVVDFNGTAGSREVGEVKFKIPETASSSDIFKVELVDLVVGDGLDETITFVNVYDEISILSDNNTLKEFIVNSTHINIALGAYEYSETVDGDKATIDVVKSDPNSTVSGIGEKELHYGTNTFSIVVTSESGKDMTYTLNIYRPYELVTSRFDYNATEGYLYTGVETDFNGILDGISIPDVSVGYRMENNQLIINYDNEKLLTVDVLNFSVDNYLADISTNTIFIESLTECSELKNDITLNGVTIKVFDTTGNEITEGIVQDGYKLKVYRNNVEIDEWTLNVEVLKIENLDVLEEDKIIRNIDAGTKYESLISNIITSGSIVIKDKDGNEIDRSDKVITGDIVEITLKNTVYSYVVSVRGDVNGNGVVNVNDIIILSKHITKISYLSGKEYIYAADINSDNNININDVIRVAKHIINKTAL